MKKHPFLRLVACLLALFVPVAGGMAYTSYHIDPSGLFHGEQFAREAVELLLDGTPVANYDLLQYHTRTINESLVMACPPFDTVVIGSSRVMLITADMLGTQGTFLNMGVVGAGFTDLLGTFYLCDREGKLPKTVFLGIDGWTLNSARVDNRTVEDWYYAFLEKLGFETDYTPQTPARNRWLALLDPSYFQGALAYQKRDTSDEESPMAVTGDIYEQTTTVKRPDGTILYDAAFRSRPVAQGDAEAAGLVNSPALLIEGWNGPDAREKAYFEGFIDYMQARDIEVVLYLTPYHPILYDAMVHDPGCAGAFAAEEYIRALAEEKSISVIGSFDPGAMGLTNEDFYDHFHLREAGQERVLADFRDKG